MVFILARELFAVWVLVMIYGGLRPVEPAVSPFALEALPWRMYDLVFKFCYYEELFDFQSLTLL